MMQFNALQAYLEDELVVVMQPDLPPTTFSLEPSGVMVRTEDPQTELKRKALAYASWGPMMIRLKAYHR